MSEAIKLIALRPAFYGGSRVKPGHRFTIPAGSKVPSWAAPETDVEIRPTGTPVRKGAPAPQAKPLGDTKPAEAARAAKAKTGGHNDPLV